MNSLGWTGRVSLWSAGHRWRVIGAWVVALVIVMLAAVNFKHGMTAIKIMPSNEACRLKLSQHPVHGG